jgi:hypothetical protein
MSNPGFGAQLTCHIVVHVVTKINCCCWERGAFYSVEHGSCSKGSSVLLDLSSIILNDLKCYQFWYANGQMQFSCEDQVKEVSIRSISPTLPPIKYVHLLDSWVSKLLCLLGMIVLATNVRKLLLVWLSTLCCWFTCFN